MPPRPTKWTQATWFASNPLCEQLPALLAWDSYAAHYWENDRTVISHDRLAEKRLSRYQPYGREQG